MLVWQKISDDLATSVWDPFQDKVNGIKVHSNPATEHIEINPSLLKGEIRIDESHLLPVVYFVRYGSRAEKFVKWRR